MVVACSLTKSLMHVEQEVSVASKLSNDLAQIVFFTDAEKTDLWMMATPPPRRPAGSVFSGLITILRDRNSIIGADAAASYQRYSLPIHKLKWLKIPHICLIWNQM